MSQEILATRKPESVIARVKPGFRPEVQGLRALAVLMVVTYHIWFGRVSGGVDIFLLISAFLLTLSFVRKLEAGRALDLGRYWLHMFKRLLPAVVVVLLGILVATALFVPRSRWSEILSQTWSSLFYFQNWALAANSVDYYATDQSVASPLQHFWSLSVQGQVFILWPLLFALAALIAKATKIRVRKAVLFVFGAVFLVSLTFSVYETYTNQVHAYFDTRTRLWEFAFGTLLVLALPYLKLPRPIRVAAGWVGLAAMLSGGFILDVQGQFPGFVALWPLVAAALVIVAGQTGSAYGADRFLSWKPLIRLGDMSYALYLWHWPVLVIYLIWRGREEVGPVGGTAIIALSLLLAYLTTKFVERPLRSMQWAEKKKRRAAVVIAVCVSLVAAPVVGWQQMLRASSAVAWATASSLNPGAAVLDPGYDYDSDRDVAVVPTAFDLQKDWVALDTPCQGRYATGLERLQGTNCSQAVVSDNPDKILVAVGNSHLQQWVAALEPIATSRNWTVIVLAQGYCQFVLGNDAMSPECIERNEQAIEYIGHIQPDAVLSVATHSVGGPLYEMLPGGFDRAAEEVIKQGVPMVGIRDNPRFDQDMGVCPEDSGKDSPECNPLAPPERVQGSALAVMQDILPAMSTIDMEDLLCPDGVCPAVIGNVRVYLDSHHLSATYVRSMAPAFEARLLGALNWR